MFTQPASQELDQRVIDVRLGVDFVPKLFVEVGGHGVVSLPPFYPTGTCVQ
jgi:hypothetical protein